VFICIEHIHTFCMYMHICDSTCVRLSVYVPTNSWTPMYSCTGAAQEGWLSGRMTSEKNIFEKNFLHKKEGIQNKKFLLKQSIVLEECLKLLDQSGAARDSSRVSTTDVRASRLTIQLAVVYRELGRPDQAKSLLNSLLFRLRMKQEQAQDERRYVRSYITTLYIFCLHGHFLVSPSHLLYPLCLLFPFPLFLTTLSCRFHCSS
jgi:Tetratrico peptide repeat